MGYNAAGKSTLVKSYTDQGYIRANRDLLGGSLEECATKAGNILRNFNKPVVLDNTYPSVKSRASIIRAAQVAKVPIRCVHLTTSLEDAQLNACLRMMKKIGTIPNPEDFKGYSKDPNVFPPAAIYRYRKQFEKPTLAEGFSQIINEAFIRVWEPEYVNKAIICDYDGTLRICNDGSKFPTKPGQIKILPNRTETLKKYQRDGYVLLGASNQSGVAKGDFTFTEADHCFEETNRLIGVDIDYLFCQHRVPPITCYCRKPAPGMGAYFIEKYKLLPSKCIMVGDMGGDKSFAARCGFQYVDAEVFFK
jgi:HAD superfamily hydrolase (TIGR01662 family)